MVISLQAYSIISGRYHGVFASSSLRPISWLLCFGSQPVVQPGSGDLTRDLNCHCLELDLRFGVKSGIISTKHICQNQTLTTQPKNVKR